MKVVKIIIRNIKKILCIGFVVEIISYIYCMPIEYTEFVSYIIKNFVLSLAFLLMIHVARVNNATGATKMFSKIKSVKYSEFYIAILTLIAALLGIIIMLKTRQFENSCLVIPSVIGLYSAARASDIYDIELKKDD